MMLIAMDGVKLFLRALLGGFLQRSYSAYNTLKRLANDDIAGGSWRKDRGAAGSQTL
jgi:hypothetical protein